MCCSNGGEIMRFKMYFTLENTRVPIDYRRSILSFIKLSLSEYSEEFFKKYYNQKDNIVKPYAFSVFFRNPKISAEEVIVEDKKIELNITIEDYETAIMFYNAFNSSFIVLLTELSLYSSFNLTAELIPDLLLI